MKATTTAREQASALIISQMVIFLVVAFIGVAVSLTTATVRLTDNSGDLSELRSAAEGALDFGYGVWAKKINNNANAPVPTSVLTAAMSPPPSFPPFSYADAGPLEVRGTDQYGRPDAPDSSATPSPTRINLDNYPGWVGINTSYVASVRMKGIFRASRTVEYGVKRTVSYTVVPLFQAMAFFEDNLELYRTAPMTIGGLVHTNSKAYVSSQVNPTSGNPPSLTFSGNLSYAGGYTDGRWRDANNIERDAPPEAWNWSGYVANNSFTPGYSNGGRDQQVTQVNRIEPLGANATTLLHPPVFDIITGVPRTSGDVNPNDDTMRELIEPPNTYVNPITQKITTTGNYTDPQVVADRRLYNKAGIRIRMSGSTPTVTLAHGTTLTAAQITALKASLTQQNITDRREGKIVGLTTLDISKAKTQVSSTVPGALQDPSFNRILYIDDLSSTGYTAPKAIRLSKGSDLPTGGLTVASQNPVYIQGNYNTTSQSTRGSAAVFGDGVTILSNAWNDGNSSLALSNRDASNTTVNTAIVAGFLPSGWIDPKTGAQYGYSGGLNNFPRFLEDWTGRTFTYTGSMIELFTSQVATGEWDTGSIYVPPTRVWNFDTNFTDNPPPGSLDAVSMGRGALVRY